MSVETEKHDEDEKQDEKRTTVKVKATYQPTTAKFQNRYPSETTVGPVKVDVMAFFEVAERTEGRRVYTYHLFLGGQPQNDLSRTLGDLAGERREIELQLVEQIVES